MIKLIQSFLLMLILVATSSFAAESNVINIKCAKRLQPHLKKILKLEEGRKLIETVYKDGPICIGVNSNPAMQQFGAFWDAERRIIHVNAGRDRSEGELIGSILFELHNALVTKNFDELDAKALRGNIDREGYVRSVEYLEFKNSHNAAAIANKGIKTGIFPESAFMPTYPTFEEHYHVQKIGGHSQWIGNTFDQLTHRT